MRNASASAIILAISLGLRRCATSALLKCPKKLACTTAGTAMSDGPHVLSTIPGGEIGTCMYTFHPSIHPIVQAIRKSRSSKAQNLGSSVFCDFIATISDISLLSKCFDVLCGCNDGSGLEPSSYIFNPKCIRLGVCHLSHSVVLQVNEQKQIVQISDGLINDEDNNWSAVWTRPTRAARRHYCAPGFKRSPGIK